MERSKTASYLGFARRAGKLTLGVYAASTLKRGVFLLVADSDVKKNSLKEIQKMQIKFGCPLLFTEGLGAMVGKDVKLAAVCDKELAAAIVAASQNG